MDCPGAVNTLVSQESNEGRRTGISGYHTGLFQKRKNTSRWKVESLGLGLGLQGQISRQKHSI